ncbi:MAG: hypothetical protein AMJ90_02680 [candidate division Zixibacteria bacterium SM23_73_2]|nr:MAG: hypothetical protein AMJ90_02680 [candidate division Zixibacteria bacterium SM23_73_2]
MNKISQDIKRLEKKDWHLWLLTVMVLMVFGAFILIIIFFSDIQDIYAEELSQYNFTILFLGFSALSLFFSAYVLLKEHFIKKLREDLIKQRILAYNLETRFKELKALFEVSTLVNSETEVVEVLDTICYTVLQCLDGETSKIVLYDSTKGKLSSGMIYSKEKGKIEKFNLDSDRAIVDWVLLNKKPLLWNKESYTPLAKENPALSAMYVPLKVKDQVKGVLNVAVFKGEKQFNQSDLKLLLIFAENATLSIVKAELYQKLKSRTRVLEDAIRDLKSTQSQLVQSEKLRGLGELAGGAAHELNNMLAVISGRTELLLKQVKDQDITKQLEIIQKATDDATGTIRKLQEFARAEPDKLFLNVDVNKMIQQAIEITKPKWKDEAEAKGIKIEIFSNLKDVGEVMGEPAELREVFTNLIFNSIDALPQGGKIFLETDAEKDSVSIGVRDTGIGMIDEVKKRAFDPFFSTKGVKRIGLGLSTAYGIILRHKGTIDVDSQPDVGTTFLVKLPKSKEEKLFEKKGELPYQLPPQDILLVEDQKEVRRVIEEMLVEAGHRVKIARSGEEGLKIFKKGEFDLVFTDLGMESMSGWELAERLKKINSDTKVALITGWGSQIDTEEAKIKGVDFVISKPFTQKKLLSVLSQARVQSESAFVSPE